MFTAETVQVIKDYSWSWPPSFQDVKDTVEMEHMATFYLDTRFIAKSLDVADLTIRFSILVEGKLGILGYTIFM